MTLYSIIYDFSIYFQNLFIFHKFQMNLNIFEFVLSHVILILYGISTLAKLFAKMPNELMSIMTYVLGSFGSNVFVVL